MKRALIVLTLTIGAAAALYRELGVKPVPVQ
jgi:hypothetical protein